MKPSNVAALGGTADVFTCVECPADREPSHRLCVNQTGHRWRKKQSDVEMSQEVPENMVRFITCKCFSNDVCR